MAAIAKRKSVAIEHSKNTCDSVGTAASKFVDRQYLRLLYRSASQKVSKVVVRMCNELLSRSISGLGGLEVACWPLVPKFAGSHPAEAVRILRAKYSSARLPSKGK